MDERGENGLADTDTRKRWSPPTSDTQERLRMLKEAVEGSQGDSGTDGRRGVEVDENDSSGL